MLEKESWMRTVIEKLKQQFNSRLLFVGLQGSYQRNEPTETSDFDVVVVLDEFSINDLAAYRSIIKTMPENEKTCGFVSGRNELLNWPRYEIFQLKQDTKSYYGHLEDLLPAYTETDIRQSVKIASANLYHAVCHQYLFAEESAKVSELKPLFKSLFFVLQLVEYLRSGKYYPTKSVLLQHLVNEEKEMLEIGRDWEKYQGEISLCPDKYYEMLLNWCKTILCDTESIAARTGLTSD